MTPAATTGHFCGANLILSNKILKAQPVIFSLTPLNNF